MTILLFGISNVGKTTCGKLLAQKLGYLFFDIDEEVKHKFNITLEEYVSNRTLYERDQIRCDIICSLLENNSDQVIAVPPLSHIANTLPYLSDFNIFTIELIDSPENIFDRLVFSDENDVIYDDDNYKYEHMNHYLSEIGKDLAWYGSVYSNIKNKFDMQGHAPEFVVDTLISAFHLETKKG